MTNEEFLREIAIALTRLEDVTLEESRDILYELALRIYALLLRYPEGQLERAIAWAALRADIEAALEAASGRLAPVFEARLIAAQDAVLRVLRTRYGLGSAELPPLPPTVLRTEAVVHGASVAQLFDASGWQRQMLRIVERTVQGAALENRSTAAILARILTVRTVAGTPVPTVTKGTVANAIIERHRNLVAGTLWSLVTPAQLRAVAASPSAQPTEWVWNAVLDPRTCPICRPLHGTRAPTPSAFPQGPPPLHARCRCITLPL